MKTMMLVLLSLNFLFAAPAFSDPGGTTTPFPFGLNPEDLVGLWINPNLATSLTIQYIPAAKGQREKIFVVVENRSTVSKGYLYATEAGFCGTMSHPNGKKSPLCLWGRFGLLTVEAEQSRFYFSHHEKTATK